MSKNIENYDTQTNDKRKHPLDKQPSWFYIIKPIDYVEYKDNIRDLWSACEDYAKRALTMHYTIGDTHHNYPNQEKIYSWLKVLDYYKDANHILAAQLLSLGSHQVKLHSRTHRIYQLMHQNTIYQITYVADYL